MDLNAAIVNIERVTWVGITNDVSKGGLKIDVKMYESYFDGEEDRCVHLEYTVHIKYKSTSSSSPSTTWRFSKPNAVKLSTRSTKRHRICIVTT